MINGGHSSSGGSPAPTFTLQPDERLVFIIIIIIIIILLLLLLLLLLFDRRATFTLDPDERLVFYYYCYYIIIIIIIIIALWPSPLHGDILPQANLDFLFLLSLYFLLLCSFLSCFSEWQ